jgi:hypothetical protein
MAAKGSELAAKWQQMAAGLGDALERRWRTRAAGADFVQMMHEKLHNVNIGCGEI